MTVPRDGQYRFELDEMMAGMAVSIGVYAEKGNTINADGYSTSGEGITTAGLKAGQALDIRVQQKSGFGTYQLKVGTAKEKRDVTGYTVISDSTEFTGQKNHYTFVMPGDGICRMELAEMMANAAVAIEVKDRLGNRVNADGYCTSGEGLTLTSLKAGETYDVIISQSSGYSGYELRIGPPKPVVALTGNIMLEDSIQYTDQQNVYTIAAQGDRLRLTLSEIPGSGAVALDVRDRLGNRLNADGYMQNGEKLEAQLPGDGSKVTIYVAGRQGRFRYRLNVEQ
jgi:hypothetical protein